MNKNCTTWIGKNVWCWLFWFLACFSVLSDQNTVTVNTSRIEEFYRKTGYIHFCQFEIFAIKVAYYKENMKIYDTFDHNFENIHLCIMSYVSFETKAIFCIIYIRYFSGALKTHIFVPLIFICNNTHIEYKAKSPIDYCVNLPCNNKPYCALLSSITRMRRTLCALQSRSARYVTMERRAFARTLLWRNNHIHDTLSIVT